jgi:hypothetical protein
MTFFAYILVNSAMITGLMPVKGVPLPLISYGGTSAVSLLVAFGILMSIHGHRRGFGRPVFGRRLSETAFGPQRLRRPHFEEHAGPDALALVGFDLVRTLFPCAPSKNVRTRSEPTRSKA